MASYARSDDKAHQIATFLAAERRPIARSEIIQALDFTGVTPLTVARWIDQGKDRGWITKSGVAGGTTYEASPQFRIEHAKRLLDQPLSKRKKVGYNDDWIASYRPNQTFYLSKENRDRLHRRSPAGRATISQLSPRDIKLFMCDLSFASSKLEGNEYDYASTIRLFDDKIEKTGGSNTDRIMLLNHYEATKFMMEWAHQAQSDPTDDSNKLTAHEIRALHALLSADLLIDPRMCGNLRSSHVEISYSSYVPPDIPDAIKQRFEFALGKAAQIEDPFEQAFFILTHVPYLQPFEDCNKRTSRVACNLPLLRAGIMPMSWLDTPHRDYINGILAVYEANETALLEEVFVDGYLRATERFELTQRAKEPSQIAVKYRAEIRESIRNRVLNDDNSIPDSVPRNESAEFMLHVENQLQAIAESPFSGVRFGLTPDRVESWSSQQRPHAHERCRG